MAANTSPVILRLSVEGAQKVRRALQETSGDADKLGRHARRIGDDGTAGFGALRQAVDRNRQSISTLATNLGGVATVVGGALAVGLVSAVRAASAFDSEMSKVAAVSNATAGQLGQLRDAAIEAGKATVFSASEAATAQSELAKAGISTADILGGALTGSLDLAAAGGLDLANAATISSQAMNIFGLAGSDVGHIADVLAAGANKSAADVGTLGDALRQGGLVAAQTGLSLEETVGALSAFADSALVGSDAGTSLKTMLQRLTPQSAEAQQLMDQLGFSAYDAAGNFIGLEGLAGELQDSLAGMTVEQRNAAMSVLFGSDAVRGANVLYEQGAEGIAGYVAAVDDAGAAQRTAAALTDNLAGDLEALGGSWETLLIGFGEGAQGPLRGVTQELTGVLNAVTELPEPVQQAAVGLGAIGAAGGLSAGGLLLLLPRIMETRHAIGELAQQFPRLASGLKAGLAPAFGAVGVAAAIGVGAITLWVQAQERARQRAEDFTRAVEADTGAIGANTRAHTVNRLEQEGALALAQQLGVDAELLTDAVTDEAGARARLNDELDRFVGAGGRALQQAAEEGAARGDAAGAVDEWTRANAAAIETMEAEDRAASQLRGKIGAVGGELDTGADAAARMATAMGETGAAGVEAAPGLDAAAAAAASAAEEAAELTDAQKALQDALLGFVDPSNAYSTALTAAQEAVRARGEEAINTYRTAAEAGGEFTEAERAHLQGLQAEWDATVENTVVSVDSYLSELTRQVEAQQEWETNMLLLSGRVSQSVLDEFTRMGPEGAPLVAEFVNASAAELGRLEGLFAGGSQAAVDAARVKMEEAAPVLRVVAHRLGQETADGLAEALAAGTTTVANVVGEYGGLLAGGLNPILRGIGKPEITVSGGHGAGREQEFAAGGVVPGSGVGDTVPAWLTPREYVLTTSMADEAGLGNLEAWRSGRIDFAGLAQEFAVGGNVQGLNPEFLRRLNAWSDAVGETYNVGSGWRSMESQQRLYARWLARVPGQAPAAPPGRSNHNYGLASDGPHWRGRNPGAFGLVYPMSYEPWHVEPVGAKAMRGGASPDGGYGYSPLPTPPTIDLAGPVGMVAAATMQHTYDAAQDWAASAFGPVAGMGDLGAFAGGGDAASARLLGQQMSAARGWGAHWSSLDALIRGESGWNPRADNPTSTAAELFQFLDSTRRDYGLGPPPNPISEQLRTGLDYIADRYGDPTRAYAAWSARSPHWYSQGGEVTPVPVYDNGGVWPAGTLGVNASPEPEAVFTQPQLTALLERSAQPAAGADDSVHFHAGSSVTVVTGDPADFIRQLKAMAARR